MEFCLDPLLHKQIWLFLTFVPAMTKHVEMVHHGCLVICKVYFIELWHCGINVNQDIFAHKIPTGVQILPKKAFSVFILQRGLRYLAFK